MSIAEHIQHIQKILIKTALEYQRAPESIHLLAVSKTHSVQAITEAYQAGIHHFGENYLQEALHKMQALASLPLCWHFIGPVQSNKTQEIARHFDWVHSVSREKIAQQLARQRPASLAPLNICLQINLDDEDNKSGIAPDRAAELAMFVQTLPALKLRGLMVIPKVVHSEQQQFNGFMRLTHLFNELNSRLNLNMDTLSMGMSDDFKAAIQAGSTFIRIGRAIFGERI